MDEVAPTVSQTEDIAQIALATGEFLSTHLKGELIPGNFPVFSATKLNVGGGVFVNSEQVEKGKIGDNSVIDIHGSRDILSQFLPDLVPSNFPQNGSNLKVKVRAYDPPFDYDSAVFFKEIEIKNNESARFTGGDPFHIGMLKIKKQAILNLAAGTYFVKELDMKKGDGARINITSEPVKLHIGKKFNVRAKQVSFNKGGKVTGFTVYLHRDSSFEAKEIDFTGVIYGPENKKVKLEKMSVKGAVIVTGEVELKKDLDINYTAEDSEVVNSTIITP